MLLSNKALQLAVRHKVPGCGVVPATELSCYVSRLLSAIGAIAAVLAIFASPDAKASDVESELKFVPPLDPAEVALLVAKRQAKTEDLEVHLGLTIEFGTRDAWQNGCAWLTEHRDRVLRMWVPSDFTEDGPKFYCLILERRNFATEDWLDGLVSVADEAVDSFGGAQHIWRFTLVSRSLSDPTT